MSTQADLKCRQAVVIAWNFRCEVMQQTSLTSQDAFDCVSHTCGMKAMSHWLLMLQQHQHIVQRNNLTGRGAEERALGILYPTPAWYLSPSPRALSFGSGLLEWPSWPQLGWPPQPPPLGQTGLTALPAQHLRPWQSPTQLLAASDSRMAYAQHHMQLAPIAFLLFIH